MRPSLGTPTKVAYEWLKMLSTDTYGLVDLQASLRPRFFLRNTLLSLSVNNIFNHSYATFVGVPKLGRMVVSKLSYTF